MSWPRPRARPDLHGMTCTTDVLDWLGSHPYESAAPSEIDGILKGFGFGSECFFPCTSRVGLLGVERDECVFSQQR